jgi:hypothetical protein
LAGCIGFSVLFICNDNGEIGMRKVINPMLLECQRLEEQIFSKTGRRDIAALAAENLYNILIMAWAEEQLEIRRNSKVWKTKKEPAWHRSLN